MFVFGAASDSKTRCDFGIVCCRGNLCLYLFCVKPKAEKTRIKMATAAVALLDHIGDFSVFYRIFSKIIFGALIKYKKTR